MLVCVHREMELLLVPYWSDPDLDLIRWPPFLLASKVKICLMTYVFWCIHFPFSYSDVISQIPIALDMAKDSNGKDRELKKRLAVDSYMTCAVSECYASFKNLISYLVIGERERQ